MIVLLVLFIATLLARLLGVIGISLLDSWPAAARTGLCAMFVFTALAHFNSMRHELARMVPPILPHPLALVRFTGFCELFGALGLLLPATRTYAAVGLILLLIAVAPANIYAAKAQVPLRGKPATPLSLRIPMQLFFIALVWWAGILHAG
jgi:uncharacterized membrane protein